MLQSTIKRTRERLRPRQTTPVRIASVTKAAAVMTIVFNQPVSLKGIPQYTTDLPGVTPISASLTNPTTLSLTFSATVATATEVRIPFEDPGIRNAVGGFVSDSTFPA
ncbi:MAG TPA: hypothetical protein VGQ99_06610 [Tepidisphaeraceae bacterium]|jgi:hypothetical protein|nr:hypothetical protein [Tepidisphaeraceae bacterium]